MRFSNSTRFFFVFTLSALLSALLFGCGAAATTGACETTPAQASSRTQYEGPREGVQTTAEFRAHHAEIHAGLEAASAQAMTLTSAPEEELGDRVHEIVHFLHHVLIPHAQLEERILYPIADQLAPMGGSRRYTDGLRYEHVVVAREVAVLYTAMQRGDHSPEAILDFQRRTLELVGLVKAHFGVEEDVILTLFDEQMSPEEFDREVVQPMHAEEGEGEGGHHHHH